MRWAVFAVAFLSVAGCRQLLGLDEGAVIDDASGPIDGEVPVDVLPDSLTGHDEDLDSIPDLADNCPSVANTDQAIETDVVGVACDPRPNVAGDYVATFLPFYPTGMPAELEMTNVVYGDDEVALDGNDLRFKTDIRAIRIAANIAATTFGPNGQIEISIGARTCQIEACGSSYCVRASDGVMSASQAISPQPPYAGMFTLTQTAAELRCTLELGASPVTAALFESGGISNRPRVRASRAMFTVKSVTIYGPPP